MFHGSPGPVEWSTGMCDTMATYKMCAVMATAGPYSTLSTKYKHGGIFRSAAIQTSHFIWPII